MQSNLIRIPSAYGAGGRADSHVCYAAFITSLARKIKLTIKTRMHLSVCQNMQSSKYFHASQVKLPVNFAVRGKMLVKNKGKLLLLLLYAKACGTSYEEKLQERRRFEIRINRHKGLL